MIAGVLLIRKTRTFYLEVEFFLGFMQIFYACFADNQIYELN